MDLDTHGVSNNKKFSLSNYPLIYQIFLINLLVSFIGFLSLIFFNFYIIKNETNLLLDYENAHFQINRITKYLEQNSILRVPLFNEYCDEENNNIDCKDIIISEPELDPTISQKFIFQNFLRENIEVKIYNDNWIKFADTNDMYISNEVSEIDITEKNQDSLDLFSKYRLLYTGLFDKIRSNFIYSKYFKNSEKLRSEINIVSETIKNKKILTKKIYNKDKDILQIISSPIINNNKIYGVVIVSYPLISSNINLGLNSFNLFNFFSLFVVVMILLSFFFSKGLVTPLKILTNLTVLERDKIKNYNLSKYPNRRDEIGMLSNRIKEMTIDLKSQIEELEKFAADVSHELKNPLTSLRSANELLSNNKISDEDKKLLIYNSSKDIDRMNRLISDISYFTKIKSEIESENFEYLDLNRLIKNICKEYHENKKKIKILIEEKAFQLSILANKNKLSQVFYNLIDNSMSILENNKNILIQLQLGDMNNVLIKIYDQGKGIPIELAEKIFERFYTDRDIKKNYHTGLGLAISREIINSFRGYIKLIKSDNIDYSGACFIINLPLKVDQTKKNNQK